MKRLEVVVNVRTQWALEAFAYARGWACRVRGVANQPDMRHLVAYDTQEELEARERGR